MKRSQTFFHGMGRLTEYAILDLRNKSHAITAQVTVRDAGANGVIMAQNGALGGFRICVRNGRPSYCYDLLGLHRFDIRGDRPIPPGKHEVRVELAYDGNGLGKGLGVSVFIDGEKVGEGRVSQTQAFALATDDTLDIGYDASTSEVFSGTVHWVKLETGTEDDVDEQAERVDRVVAREHRPMIAMAKQ